MPRKKKIASSAQPSVLTQSGKPLGPLPVGWAATTLGEIVLPSRERGLPNDYPDLPYIGMEHVEAQTMRLLGQGNALDIRSTSVLFKKGNILYGKMRPYLNKVWVAEFDGLCSAEFLVFPCPGGVNSRFLALRLNSQDFVSFANQSVSGDRPRADFDKLASFQILLPPTAEQERIVAKLDAMLSRIAAGESAARRALERLDCFRASVLHAAVTGELTREWRETHKPEENGEQLLKRLLVERRKRWETAEFQRLVYAGKRPKNDKWRERYQDPIKPSPIDELSLPKEWSWATIAQLSCLVQYGSSAKTAKDVSGVPVLRMGNIIDGELDVTDLKYLPKRHAEFPSLLLEKGDMLFNRTNSMELVGKSAIYRGTPQPCLFASYLIRVRFLNIATAEIATYFINSDQGRKWITSVASQQVGQANVNGSKLQRLSIPIPPLAEQTELIREKQKHFDLADRVAHRLMSKLTNDFLLRQSLLRKAFEGQLSTENAKDESAAILLQRIINHRKQLVTTKNGRNRMPRQKSKTLPDRQPPSLLDVIRHRFTSKPFTFEDLRECASYKDYDSLKNRFFELLRNQPDGSPAPIRMSFNSSAKVIEYQLNEP